jgi:hypothetical protein
MIISPLHARGKAIAVPKTIPRNLASAARLGMSSPKSRSNCPSALTTYIAIAVTAMLILIAGLWLMGRGWWCEKGLGVWTWQTDGACTSQQLGDFYSFTHVEHGFLFYWIVSFARNRMRPTGRFAAATALEMSWEFVENTAWVIDRYRDQTAALGYSGDSILNSCGDLLACCLGYAIAAMLPAKGTIALAITIEVALLLLIRDNLVLNVLMLIFPLAAIERWQLGR